MEMDPEHKDDGNHYTTYFRQYDPRLGRWMSLDPESAIFPFEANYVANHNNPVCFIDSEGDLPILVPVALNALIGASTDLAMQFFKNLFKYDKNIGRRFSLRYAWQNIDWIDVALAGIQGGVFPTTNIFNPFASGGAKEVTKRVVKWITKTLMFFFDGKFEDVKDENENDKGDVKEVDRKFQIRIAFLDPDSENNIKGKKKSDLKIDGISTALGLGLLEIDLQTGIFYNILYGKGSMFDEILYGYYIWHQIAYNFTHQTVEGILKGGWLVVPVGEIIKEKEKRQESSQLESPEMSSGFSEMKGVQNFIERYNRQTNTEAIMNNILNIDVTNKSDKGQKSRPRID